MIWIKKAVDFLLFSSFFIAFCAVSFCMETNVMLGLPLNSFSFYCFVFGATLVQYNVHYLIKTRAAAGSERFLWSVRNRKFHVLLFCLGCGLILFSFFGFRIHHFYILVFLGLISALYSVPLLPFPNKKRIKDFGFTKIITLSLLWTLVTVWLPVAEFKYDEKLYFFIFIKRFIFMFVLCLLFDIRDEKIDYEEGIQTIPVRLGKKRSYMLAYASLLIFVILVIAQYLYLPQPEYVWGMLLSVAITWGIIEATRKTNSDYIYLAGIDGMMLIQALLIYAFSLKM